MTQVWIAGKRRALACHPSPAHLLAGRPFLLADPEITLPPAADLRGLWPRIKDQGQVGDCAANAGCEVMEYLERKGADDPPFSVLALYYWARMAEGTPPEVDSGLRLTTVADVLARRGVCYDQYWDYHDAEARYVLAPTLEAERDALNHRAMLSLRCPTPFVQRASIAAGFPVMFGAELYPSFTSSEAVMYSGQIPIPGRDELAVGGHAMVKVGYDDDKQHWIVANSWGAGVGDAGFFYLPYGYETFDDFSIRRATV